MVEQNKGRPLKRIDGNRYQVKACARPELCVEHICHRQLCN